MRRPTALEWIAWAIHAGAERIDDDARRNGLPFRSPPELRELAKAFVDLAQAEARRGASDVATLPDPATQADDALVHLQEVAQRIGRSRRTVERRCRDRQIRLVKQGGRTYVHTDDIERLRD